ncbi:peroxiredoxin Q [Pterulicium gracile]|uniref:thioredoxin-dependent peroxiredoxin n=1 Tax=Pterulicium gracile TaxID=1884261 RepID=A0A5C3QK67_9AGAR|nr:peroxiredoxin Q [Pterula gracilis]
MAHNLIGCQAPSLTLPDVNGQMVDVPGSGMVNVPTAIFFYPRAGSYGCTKQACGFRDAVEENSLFRPDRLRIVGISADAPKKQKRWVEKQALNFEVLSDEAGYARKEYRVGKGLLGLVDARTTFVVDKHGVIRRDVMDATLSFQAHVDFVESWLERLGREEGEKSAVPMISEWL